MTTADENLFDLPGRYFSGTNFTIAPGGWLRCSRCDVTVPDTNDALYAHIAEHQGETPQMPA